MCRCVHVYIYIYIYIFIIGRTGWLCTSANSLNVIPPFLVIAAQPRSGPFRVELKNKVTQGLQRQHARGKNAARRAVAHPMRASPAILRARALSPNPTLCPGLGGWCRAAAAVEGKAAIRDIKIIITTARVLMLTQQSEKRRGTSEKVQLAEMRSYVVRGAGWIGSRQGDCRTHEIALDKLKTNGQPAAEEGDVLPVRASRRDNAPASALPRSCR